MALKLLQSVKAKRSNLEGTLEYEWGSSKVLQQTDLRQLSRAQLRNHLEARDLDTEGPKRACIERLEASLEEEKLQSIAYTEQLEAEFQINKDLEERGAVYAVGANYSGQVRSRRRRATARAFCRARAGEGEGRAAEGGWWRGARTFQRVPSRPRASVSPSQLGQGDHEPRRVFTVVPKTRGMGVTFVGVSSDMAFAVTADHEVMVWGGSARDPRAGVDASPEDEYDEDELLLEPQIIRQLDGEDVVGVTVGASHVGAWSSGGDLFVWGFNLCGQLGLGDFKARSQPEIVYSFQEGIQIQQAACGENHLAARTSEGALYTWGHIADGRLGLSVRERVGAKTASEAHYFPAPTIVSSLAREFVRSIACGAEHMLCLTRMNTYSWGNGAGMRLGHGDCKHRWGPTVIETLENQMVLAVAAGTWHSCALVLAPPLMEAGWIYTWGSGYHGQLAHGPEQIVDRPKPVEWFLMMNILAREIVCGSHHTAVIADDHELYTWGSNQNCCLGRDIDELDIEYTSNPGHCSGFGAIVERVGRGMVRSMACGKEFTIVATHPYEGPTEEVARKLMEEEAIREEEERLQEEEEMRQRKKAEKRAAEDAAAAEKDAEQKALMAAEEEKKARSTTSAILMKDMGSRKGGS